MYPGSVLWSRVWSIISDLMFEGLRNCTQTDGRELHWPSPRDLSLYESRVAYSPMLKF